MKKICLLLAFLVLSLFALAAADYYETGSQIFTVTLGTNVPLSLTVADANGTVTGFGPGSSQRGGTNLTMGGYGAIDYEIFTTSKISIGGELGYQFNFVSDNNIFSMVPILFKATFVPLQGKFELPLSIGAGFDYLSYNSNSKLSVMAKAEVGARYFITNSWAIGLTTGVAYMPELYSESSMNGQFTYIPISLSATYRN